MAYKETMQPSLFKEAAIQIGAGGFAGFVEASIMHPMDLIKTPSNCRSKSVNMIPCIIQELGIV